MVAVHGCGVDVPAVTPLAIPAGTCYHCRVTDSHARFQPGTIVPTIGATQIADNRVLLELLRRHTRGSGGRCVMTTIRRTSGR